VPQSRPALAIFSKLTEENLAISQFGQITSGIYWRLLGDDFHETAIRIAQHNPKEVELALDMVWRHSDSTLAFTELDFPLY
jgi:hypothetical protein